MGESQQNGPLFRITNNRVCNILGGTYACIGKSHIAQILIKAAMSHDKDR